MSFLHCNEQLVLSKFDLYEESIIQLLDELINLAMRQGASDIHLEAQEENYRLRFRQDGLLYHIATLDSLLAARLITRLKVLANLDIAERRLPQDGRVQLHLNSGRLVNLRLSSCPTLHNEKIVLRLLDNAKVNLRISELGFSVAQEKLFQEKISQPQGLILVTGPTGSGKTITLYSALAQLNSSEKNICTIEDPIEIQLAGINQVAVNPKTHLSFASVLPTFLRQDPDIMMVGEIRSRETAELAIQAAQTGHLVLSSLHTNSAIETLMRLLSMQIPPYQLVHALTLIVAQRLMRKLCVLCKKERCFSRSALGDLGIEIKPKSMNLFVAQGCSQCKDGYQGRTAIFECLNISKEIAALMLKKSDLQQLLETAREQGFVTLKEEGIEKVFSGLTSFDELHRILKT